jgi:GNAT superfamily N-acetyltransferase
MASVELIERRPTVDEYVRLIAAEQWKPRDADAIARAPAGSIFAFCAEAAPDIVVEPAFQRRGVGGRLVRALTERMEGVRYRNTWVGLFAVEGTAELYARFGYKAQGPAGPAMYRGLNRPQA